MGLTIRDAIHLAQDTDAWRRSIAKLHWLKVMERIQFRLCVLTHCCLHGTAPPYLADTLHLIADVGGRQRLRSASTSTLVVPSTRRSTLGDRAFPVAAARAWNALPSSVRAVPTMPLFRRELKRTLFQAHSLTDARHFAA